MSNYLDAIPQAVATIVSAYLANTGKPNGQEQYAAMDKWAVNLTDQLTRTFAKALMDAQNGKL